MTAIFLVMQGHGTVGVNWNSRAVCWLETEAEARTCAGRMELADAKWVAILAVLPVEEQYAQWKLAKAEIGDPCWEPVIGKFYWVSTLSRGTP